MYIENIDKKKLLNFIDGDIKAFELIYNTYSTPLYKSLVYMLKDNYEVEEIIHNSFLKLWNRRSSIDPNKNLYSFILTIAHTMAIDSIRKNVRTQVVNKNILNSTDINTGSVEEKYFEIEDWWLIEQGINQMPPQRKMIFKLSKLEGKTYQEISEQLSISTSTISNQLVLAMKFLRKYVHDYQQEVKSIALLLSIIKLL